MDNEFVKRAQWVFYFIVAFVAIMVFCWIVDTYIIMPWSKEGFDQTPEIDAVMEDRNQDVAVKNGTDPDREVVELEYPVGSYIPAWDQNVRQYGDLLDDGMSGRGSILFNKCSKSCCSPQYPVPFAVDADKSVCSSNKEYVPNNYTCNDGWNDTGCLCLDKEQSEFLAHRGGNV